MLNTVVWSGAVRKTSRAEVLVLSPGSGKEGGEKEERGDMVLGPALNQAADQ